MSTSPPTRRARLTRWARPYAGTFVLGFLLLMASNGLSLGIPWLLRGAIDAIEAGSGTRRIALFASGMAALALGRAVVRTWSRWAILGNSRKIAADVRNRFFEHLARLDPGRGRHGPRQ